MSNNVKVSVRKVADRSFTATTSFRGSNVVGEGKQRRSSIKDLENKIGAILGSSVTGLINWQEDYQDLTVTNQTPGSNITGVVLPKAANINLADFGEFATAEEPTAVNPPANILAEDFDNTVATNAAEDIPEDEREIVHPETPACPTDTGWITPWSDRAKWVLVANSTINMVLSLGFSNPKDASASFQKRVSELMESLGCLGAYRIAPSGDKFIRMCSEVNDPTVRQTEKKSWEPKPSASTHKTVVTNGTRPIGKTHPEYAPTSAPKEESAYEFGNNCGIKAAIISGRDRKLQTLGYKIGNFVKGNTKFEDDIVKAANESKMSVSDFVAKFMADISVVTDEQFKAYKAQTKAYKEQKKVKAA